MSVEKGRSQWRKMGSLCDEQTGKRNHSRLTHECGEVHSNPAKASLRISCWRDLPNLSILAPEIMNDGFKEGCLCRESLEESCGGNICPTGNLLKRGSIVALFEKHIHGCFNRSASLLALHSLMIGGLSGRGHSRLLPYTPLPLHRRQPRRPGKVHRERQQAFALIDGK